MKNIMLVGGGVGNAVLFSIGKAALAKANKVLYFAGYKKLNDLFKRTLIENACNIVVWVCEEGFIEARRAQDRSFHGNIIDAMISYKDQLHVIDKMIVIGSDKMMKAVNQARKTVLKSYFKSGGCEAISSINSPMQCMMKGICAQCIQRHVIDDKESFVYSCNAQDQSMESVDFDFLSRRLKKNSLQEKLTAKWILHNV